MPDSMVVLRATSTWCCMLPSIRSLSATAKTCIARFPSHSRRPLWAPRSQIPTLEGEATLDVPEGTQTGTSFRVRKKGMPVLNSNGRGDLYVEVKVATPEKLTRQQRELLEQLAGTLGQENQPQKSGLLNKVKDMFS